MLKLRPSPATIYGFGYFDERTKGLVRYIPVQSIAVLNHQDIDEMAAQSLLQKGVKAVLNLAPSMSGEYASLGTGQLVRAGVPVFDLALEDLSFFHAHFQQGDMLIIHDQQLYRMVHGESQLIASLVEYTEAVVQRKISQAQINEQQILKAFAVNTLLFAQDELEEILKPIQLPPLRCLIKNRHVVIVTRGQGYIEDLQTISTYINEKSPVLIGVDGGADALLQCGYCPDIILGDMDSVSTAALHCGAEIIVHAYKNGQGPGLKELKKHGVTGVLFPCFGTSEDAAQLLAYESGAELIVTLGSHTSMLDYLEKGRKGMGSSFLVRLKIGERLVDAKGIRFLASKASLVQRGD